MNTESLQDESAPKTIGQKLREARETLGLTQQDVAEHLCLRVATIIDLENDANSMKLAPTFINGYIRAYARYVNLPESEIVVSAIAEPVKAQLNRPSPSPNPSSSPKQPKRDLKSSSVKGFPLNKTTTHKKRDFILMFLTWFILIVVIGLSGVWWWQNYQLKAQDIDKMDENSTIQLNIARNEGRVVPLADSSAGENVIVLPSQDASTYTPAATDNSARLTTDTVSPSALFQQRQPFFPNPRSALTAEAVAHMKVLANTLTMTFSDSSWVTITHRVNGRTVTLFSGQKNRGESLEVSGTPPYRITLGKPSAVKVEFGGKSVPAQARFTLNAAS